MATDSDLGNRVHSANDGTDGHVRIKIVGDEGGVGTAAVHHVAVDSDKNAHVEVHGNDPAASDRILRMSEQGSASIDGAYDAALNSDPSQAGLVGMDRNVAPLDSHQIHRVTAKPNTDGSVRSLDISLHDEEGEPYTATNPMPVTLATIEGGSKVEDQNTKEDLGSSLTDNHDHTVSAGTTFRLDQIIADASADARYDLLIGDGAGPEVFTRKAMTYSSNAKRGDMEFIKGFNITAGGSDRTVRVQRKNRDNKVQDVHTTILGVTIS